MSLLVPLMMFGWIPFALAAFGMLQARTATLVVVIGGWLFLPNASYALPGLPDYTKTMAVVLAVTLGIGLFASDRLSSLRFLQARLAHAGVVPGAGHLLAGERPWCARRDLEHAGAVGRVGLPYLVGRAMFRDSAAQDQLACAVFVGGLLHVPLLATDRWSSWSTG